MKIEKGIEYRVCSLPFPDFDALGYVRLSLQRGFVLPYQEQPGEHRKGLGVDIQGPRAL